MLCKETVTIPLLHKASMKVIIGVRLNGDAWLHSIHMKNDYRLWSPMHGGWVAARPVGEGQSAVVFANMLRYPIRLHRGQPKADVTLCSVLDRLAFTAISHLPSSPMATSDAWPSQPPPTPAVLIDPYNHDPPPAGIPLDHHFFNISIAYCLDDALPTPIVHILESRKDAFTLDGRHGHVDSFCIPTNADDSKLAAEALRQVGPHKRKIIDDSIDQVVAWEVIEPSNSRVGYPVVLVHQHDKWRFCVDYRNMNLATTTQVYPMTRSDSIFDAFHGKRVFSILDAAWGYPQLPIVVQDR